MTYRRRHSRRIPSHVRRASAISRAVLVFGLGWLTPHLLNG